MATTQVALPLSVSEEAALRSYRKGVFWEVNFKEEMQNLAKKKENIPQSTFDANVTCDHKCWLASPHTDCTCSCGRVRHGLAVDPDRVSEYKALLESRACEAAPSLDKTIEKLAQQEELVLQKTLKKRLLFEQSKTQWVHTAKDNGGCGVEDERRVDRMPCGTLIADSKDHRYVLACANCKIKKSVEKIAYEMQRSNEAKERAAKNLARKLAVKALDEERAAKKIEERIKGGCTDAHRCGKSSFKGVDNNNLCPSCTYRYHAEWERKFYKNNTAVCDCTFCSTWRKNENTSADRTACGTAVRKH